MKRATLFATFLTLLLTACHKSDSTDAETIERTVLVYVAGDNNLTGSSGGTNYFSQDLTQIIEGTKNLAANNKLILFVDCYDSKPYFLQVENGDTLHLYTMEKETKSSDPAMLHTAMKYVTDNFPAKSYGLVLWGHADGWITRGEAATAGGESPSVSASRTPRKAYGVDNTNGRTWMNITDMAETLATLPKLKFIFADCCCFLCVEDAYELRDCTDYIIGSAAEIPGEGAPYQTLVPAMFSRSDNFYQEMIDAYYAQTSGGYKLPMAAVDCSMLDTLANATAVTMATFANDIEPYADGCRYPDTDGLIFYFNHTQFDMQDFFLRYASPEQYAEWKKVFDKAVPYHTFAKVWMASHVAYKSLYEQYEFLEFTPTEERMGGMGMFVPQKDADINWWPSMYIQNLGFGMSQLNSKVKDMQWYEAARLSDMGW